MADFIIEGEQLTLRADVFDYIERFYHLKRRHSTLGHMIPVQFETRQCA